MLNVVLSPKLLLDIVYYRKLAERHLMIYLTLEMYLKCLRKFHKKMCSADGTQRENETKKKKKLLLGKWFSMF